mmetsp:Transcript_146331/g.364936  ORF Transcript_146331/g.364936 Transcript_146331/m.364936 type:complete len:291 (-) Transcript_146331:30-902(-)
MREGAGRAASALADVWVRGAEAMFQLVPAAAHVPLPVAAPRTAAGATTSHRATPRGGRSEAEDRPDDREVGVAIGRPTPQLLLAVRKATSALTTAVAAVARPRLVLCRVVGDLFKAVGKEARVTIGAKGHFAGPGLTWRVPVQQLPGVQVHRTSSALRLEMVVEAHRNLALPAMLRATPSLEIRALRYVKLEDGLAVLGLLLRPVPIGQQLHIRAGCRQPVRGRRCEGPEPSLLHAVAQGDRTHRLVASSYPMQSLHAQASDVAPLRHRPSNGRGACPGASRVRVPATCT